jgi:hypothetical protein
MSTEATLGQKLWKRADKLRAKRSSVFDPQVQYLYQYFWPDVSDVNTEKTESTVDWFDRLYETTAIRASATCSIGVRNWITPSTEEWLGLSPPPNLNRGGSGGAPRSTNPRIDRLSSPASPAVDDNGMDEAQRWCHKAATQALQEFAASNLYGVVQPFNRAACVAGTSLMFMEEGKASLFRFEQFKFGTFCIAENDEKLVDTVFRWFKLTVRQAVQKFCPQDQGGEYDLSGMPPKIRKAYLAEKYDEEFEFMHACYPNQDYRRGAIGTEGMAFASVYLDSETKMVVKEGGYEEMPYFCLRWSRWGTENQVWGCSPAFETLAEARQLNAVEQFDDALVELNAFPPQIIPDSLDGNVEQASGGQTVVKAEDMVRGAVPKLWENAGRTAHQDIVEKQQKKIKAIESAFFVDTFKAVSQLGERITESTYGALALLQGEKVDQFTGTFDQYRTEVINPMVKRALGIMSRAGVLDDPPDSLMVSPDGDPKSEKELAIPKIGIKSRVTLAMGAARNIGLQKTLEAWAPMAETHPEIFDNLSLDISFRRSGRDNGMPESDFRPLKEVSGMRDARAKMQKQVNDAHLAETMGKAAGSLGKAPPALQKQVTDQIQGAAA